MPYKTTFERQKSEWMTLAQAVEYVALVENYPPTSERENISPSIAKDDSPMAWMWTPSPHSPPMETALSQLRAALQDGEIPKKWAQEQWPKSHSFFPNQLFALDEPPSGFFWQYAQIDPSANYAVSDEMPLFLSGGVVGERAANPRLRELLLLRSRVYELWPSKATDSPPPSLPRLEPAPTERRTPVISDENLIKNEARKLYDRSNPKPNIAQAERFIREAMPGAKRTLIRKILKDEEFAIQRRPAGNSGPRRR